MNLEAAWFSARHASLLRLRVSVRLQVTVFEVLVGLVEGGVMLGALV